MDHEKGAVAAVRFVEAVGEARVDREIVGGIGIHQLGGNRIEPLRRLAVALMELRPKIARPPTDRKSLEQREMSGGVLLPDFELRLFLENAYRIGECFGIFFCRNSESNSGDNSFVALAGNSFGALAGNSFGARAGNSLPFSPRHTTGVHAAAKAAADTSARTAAVAWIIANTPGRGPFPSLYSVAFIRQSKSRQRA